MIEQWYVERFLIIGLGAFTEQGSFFSHYTKLLSVQEAEKEAHRIWRSINGINLDENILPTKGRAQLILKKGQDHTVEEILLRK